MKKSHIVLLVVVLISSLAVPALYKRGVLWKRNLYLTTPHRICPVHKTPMKREMVRARERMAIADPGFAQAEMDRMFPHKNNVYFGGHRPNVALFEREYCSECRDGANKWYANWIQEAEQEGGDGDAEEAF